MPQSSLLSVHCRIGVAAKLTGVSAANIRFYEQQGLLQGAARQDNDYRVYGEADLHRLRFIRVCRSLDMSLTEVRGLLDLDGKNPRDCAQARETLDEHLQHVRQRLKELRALERELKALRERCDGHEDHCLIIEALHAKAQAPHHPKMRHRTAHV
jgi:DNA-binding transcriptional MerR regulator